MADWEQPGGFNPIGPITEGELRAAALLFSPLWGFDSDLSTYPDLVREVPTLQNGLVRLGPGGQSMTVDVRLVPGLRWSDGSALTADDLIFTWNALCDPATGAAPVPGLDRIQSMERRSDTEVIWHLDSGAAGRCGGQAAAPSGVYGAYLVIGAQLRVLPSRRLQGVPPVDWARVFFGRPDVVSGPFALGEVVPGDRITFNANSSYAAGRSWRGAYSGRGGAGPFNHAPHLARVLLRIYPSKDAMLAGLRGGEADLGFHLSAIDLVDLRSMYESSATSDPGLRDEFLNPNHDVNTATKTRPPWVQPDGIEDPGVLQALSLAIDRRALAGQALGVDLGATVSRGLFPSVLRAYVDPSLPEPRPDLGAASKLLDDAGWRGSGSDPVRAKAGRRLEFQLLGVCGSASSQRELEYLKAAWAYVGAAVRTGCGSRAQLFGSYQSGGIGATGAFDMTLYSNSWLPDPEAWASSADPAQVPSPSLPGGQNWNRCRDSALSGQFAKGVATLPAAGRRAAYLRAQREWLSYHCTVPLFEWPLVRQASRQAHNFRPGPQPGLETWNAADWWLGS
jgi:peptide/nickel transport system substrate-binding protein